MQKFFITATGTGIGKTLVTTTLCRQLKLAGKKVIALKPIISGYDAADMDNDTALILQSLNLPVTETNIEVISPWRFIAPLSPNMAAAREGKYTSLDEVVGFCEEQGKGVEDILLIEGVGGICVPLNNEHTTLDWMAQLVDWKIIVVAGSYLGAISHTLTAVKTLETLGIVLHALIVSESENSTVTLEETIKTLVNFLPKSTHIIPVPRQKKCDRNNQMLWKEIPQLSEIFK